jgi:hypothetical protein
VASESPTPIPSSLGEVLQHVPVLFGEPHFHKVLAGLLQLTTALLQSACG